MDDSQLIQGVLERSRENAEVVERFFAEHAERIVQCARAMQRCLSQGGRVLSMGNGGSACDAEHVALEFMQPTLSERPGLPALSLATSSALLSAIGNDADFSLAFMRQIKLLARPSDIALGISVSGTAANVNRGLRAARELGLLTVGFTGRDGGSMPAVCDYAFVVPSMSSHRIQEAHVTLLHVMWELIHTLREADQSL
jgi:D-sedoheptulose 7-phosphate isomerase